MNFTILEFNNLADLSREKLQINKDIAKIKSQVDLFEKKKVEILNEQRKAELKAKEQKKEIHSLEQVANGLVEKEKQLREKLQNLTRQREITSMQNEIIALQGDKEDIEKQLMVLWNESEIVAKEIAGSSKKFKEEVEDLEAKIINCQDEVAKYKAETAPLEKQIQNLAAFFPDDIKAHFLRINKKNLLSPVVQVVDSICQGCFAILPNGLICEISRNGLMICPNCYRILFFDNQAANQDR